MSYNLFSDFIHGKKQICVIQAENPDGDSLGSALALEEALSEHDISLYCPVDIPKYMRYFKGWDRVTHDFDYEADGYIIVDTSSSILLSKLLTNPAIQNSLQKKPVLIIDHHTTESDLDFPYQAIIKTYPSTCTLLKEILTANNITVSPLCAELLLYGILSDTLGLSSPTTRSVDYRMAADLLDTGISIADMEERRREFMKKSIHVFEYKADLIKRTEFYLENRLATVHIPFEDIREYSDEYNPNVLIQEELRLVEGVDVSVAIKTYPDGKVTGKIRSNLPIAEQLANFFGGGGHPYAAGFRTYGDYDDILNDLIAATDKILLAYGQES